MGVRLASYAQMKAAGYKQGKAVCPNCGEPKFVLYTDERTGAFLPSEFGRCERIDNCAYHNYPTDYFKNKGAKSPSARAVVLPVKKVNPNAPKRLLFQYVTRSLAAPNSDNYFIAYLNRIFDAKTTQFLIDEYQLGLTKANDIIFWQIDANGEVRTGKTIPYDADGKRVKNTPYPCGWIHNKVHTEYNLEQCLFGAHLLPKYSDKPVFVFESEKTALIAAIYAPVYFKDAVCVATGTESFSTDILNDLHRRETWFLPDAGCLESWKKKVNAAPQMRADAVKIEFIETLEALERNTDFADCIPIDTNGKALTLTDNLYAWPDGEIFDAFARNPITLDFWFNLQTKTPSGTNAGGDI